MTAKEALAPITAADVIASLARKHSKDVFVPECKTGSSWAGANIRLDAWAMNRSWAQMTFTGYEVKVNRGDFLSDDKWVNYLPYVHQFYFVSPRDVIKIPECPEGTGLMWVSRAGAQVIRKVKAPRREMELVDALPVLLYILMSRADIGPNRWIESTTPNADYWRVQMKKKAGTMELGRLVSSRIAARISQAEGDLQRAEALTEKIDQVDALLQEVLGLTLNQLAGWDGKDKLEDAVGLVPDALIRKLTEGQSHLKIVTDALVEFKQQGIDTDL